MKNNLFLRRTRRVFGYFRKSSEKHLGWDIEYTNELANCFGQEASDIIKEKLLVDDPFLLSRFGSDILMCAMDSVNQMSIENVCKYILGRTDYLGWRKWTLTSMEHNAGFYPATEDNLSRYGKLIIEIMPQIDILATIMKQEHFFSKELNHAVKITFEDLEPFRHKKPWSSALKGKRVLVIHPFEASIRLQYYNNRCNLFENPDVLPEFELLTIKAVQSLADNKFEDFSSWFEALEYMKTKINKLEFDVAILGCGAYGMPLAAYIKSLGKKAIHMGGATQYLFGIKSKRGEQIPEINKFFNEYWIRPLPEDYPKGFEKVEGGCYW